MKCVILQPSYIPWRGYFHQIQKSDVFVFYDDVQYDKHGWRNRNKIKTAGGPQWLSIPVHSKGNVAQHIPINQITTCQKQPWARKHWETIRQSYARAPFFGRYAPALQTFYTRANESLADFTIHLTIHLARELGITHTRFVRSSELHVEGARMERLLGVLQAVNATHYISGPSAADYIEAARLHALNISLEYITYEYPPYPQLHGAFEPAVSVLDLLFMMGPDAGHYIWRDAVIQAA